MQATTPPRLADTRVTESALLRDIAARLTAAVRKVCPASLAAAQDDIVQQAMLRVVRVIEQSEGGDPPGPSYLWKVAYTTTIDQLRRMQSQAQMRENLAQVADAAPGTSAAPSPEVLVEGGEIGVAIADCLEHLIDARRRAVVLHLQGHSVPETGELLGWSRKRAENQVYRGLADLRRCLERKGLAPEGSPE